MIGNLDTILVKGVEFTHGFNKQFEYYAHIDDKDWSWKVWKHRRGPISTKTWFVSVAMPGRNGGVKMLNTAIVDGNGDVIQSDPLYHINPYSHESLLEALVPLIEMGEWPE